jgi:polyhydroxyalkanoate synthase
VFDMIRQSYLLVSDRLLGGVDAIQGVDDRKREKLRFITRSFIDAMAPSNFALTNPLVLEKALETRGESLLKGLENMLRDISRGQLTHTDPDAFEIGRNIALSPGKVVKRTPLYELIQYSPATETVLKTPLVIFPPWINRFYILDLNPKKSFIKWAVEQGLSVFMVSWKSADRSMADTSLDDYVLRGQIDAIDTVRDLLGVASVHAIGYCVARHRPRRHACLAGGAGSGLEGQERDLLHRSGRFLGSRRPQPVRRRRDPSADRSDDRGEGLSRRRYMAATFNMLRGRDLIWNYVGNNYLMGEDYPPFRPAPLERRHHQPPGQMAPCPIFATSTATTSSSSPAGSWSTGLRSTSPR